MIRGCFHLSKKILTKRFHDSIDGRICPAIVQSKTCPGCVIRQIKLPHLIVPLARLGVTTPRLILVVGQDQLQPLIAGGDSALDVSRA